MPQALTELHFSYFEAIFHKKAINLRQIFGRFKKMQHLCTALSERHTSTYWKDGRVIDCTGLENRRTARYRGFESLSFRKSPGHIKSGAFFVSRL